MRGLDAHPRVFSCGRCNAFRGWPGQTPGSQSGGTTCCEVPLNSADFAAPPEDRHFEDYVPGAVFEYGEIPVTQAEIVEFARRFDPQYIHVDRERAAQGPFGGLIASGLHTTAMMMRLIVDHFLPKRASLG